METDYSVNELLIIPNNEKGNYVKLPESLLESIVDKYNGPYYFNLKEKITGLNYFVGVKEFTAEPGTIEMPKNVQENLCGEFVTASLITNVSKGEFAKLKVIPETFYKIPNYDKILQNELSNYCILEKNQIIKISIFNTNYQIKIISMKSKLNEHLIEQHLIDIVNIDLKVDFDFPEEIIKPTEPTEPKELKITGRLLDTNKNPSQEEMRMRRLKYFLKSEEL